MENGEYINLHEEEKELDPISKAKALFDHLQKMKEETGDDVRMTNQADDLENIIQENNIKPEDIGTSQEDLDKLIKVDWEQIGNK